jgi:hypothetical protein
MSPPVSAMMISAARRPTPGDGVEVGHVLVVILGQGLDPLVQHRDEPVEVVDLVGQVPAHERVMVGEGAIQRLDQRGGQLHPGVLQLLLQPLRLLAQGDHQLTAAAGQVRQLPDRPLGHERGHHHARGAGPGQERGITGVALTAPDSLEMSGVD